MTRNRRLLLASFVALIVGISGCGGGSSGSGGGNVAANSNSCVNQTKFNSGTVVTIKMIRLTNNCGTAVNVGKYFIGPPFSETFRLGVGESRDFLDFQVKHFSCAVPSVPLIFPGDDGLLAPELICSTPV